MKYLFKGVMSLFIVQMLFSCQAFKMARFYLSENHQKPSFPSDSVAKNESYTFTFAQGSFKQDSLIASILYTPPQRKRKKMRTFGIEEYLDKETKTTAFLVIRNDSILFQRYFEGYESNSQLPSFSMAKSVTSILVGIAIQHEIVKSENDTVTQYLPELASRDALWNDLTINHLLNMRSGIDFNEENYVNPHSDIANLYFTKDIKRIVEKVTFVSTPGSIHYYSSLDTQILGLILERASGKPLAKLLEEWIWKPLGMEYNAEWQKDSKKNNQTKAFCCINAAAKDYAKFGRLYLDKGTWKGKQVLSHKWVEKATKPNFDNGCYQYQWYSGNKTYRYEKDNYGKNKLLVLKDSLEASQKIRHPYYEKVVKTTFQEKEGYVIKKCGPQFYALGVFGQEIYVDPEDQLIFVRLGKRWDVSNEYLFKVIKEAVKKV